MNFFEVHSIWFLVGLLFFPRITAWFWSNLIGGLFFWPAFMIFPRAFCAGLGIIYYWNTNPLIVCFGLFLGALFEYFEKRIWWSILFQKKCCKEKSWCNCTTDDRCCG